MYCVYVHVLLLGVLFDRMQCAFGKWREIVARRLDQRQQTADELHHRMLTRRVWQGWRKVHVTCTQCALYMLIYTQYAVYVHV